MKRKIRNKYTFLFFSCILFFIISIGAFIAYIFTARQINRTFVQQQLNVADESIKLRLATEINHEVSLVLKLANSPLIQEYFLNPNDPILQHFSFRELQLFQQHSSEGLVFWINDIDKIFYSVGTDSYFVNPDDPANYWYYYTLNETEDYNFNINYNPDLDVIYLWVNVPVFVETADSSKKAIGMLGTGLNLANLTQIVELTRSEQSRDITVYLFNQYHEITIASDFNLVQNKVHLVTHLEAAGEVAIDISENYDISKGLNYVFGDNMYRIGVVPILKDWCILLSYPLPGILALNRPLNIVFFGMLFLIFTLFVIMNIFVSRSNKEMIEHYKQLREVNKKLSMVVQATKIGLWDMDIINDDLTNPTNAFNWSDEFRQMLGYTNEIDFPNLLGSWIDRLHPEDRERTLEQAVRHILDKTGNTPYDTEYRLKRKNGEYGYFRAYGGTYKDDDGNTRKIAGSLIDITKEKNILEDMYKQKNEAFAANKAKSDFLAKISHEIRTPLNAIIGITQIQLQKQEIKEEYSEALMKIYDSGRSLLAIINDILDLSKLETGKMELQPLEYSMPSLIHDSVQLNILQIGSKPIEFILDINENIPQKLIGDELRIKQILNNLLSNAIKYTQKGHIKLSITHFEPAVSLTLSDDNVPKASHPLIPKFKFSTHNSLLAHSKSLHVGGGGSKTPYSQLKTVFLKIVVEDTGQGMKQEDCEKLFSEYLRFNIKANRDTEGTGIGLNITKNLVELMEGSIDVESKYGVGSTFTVQIKQTIRENTPIGKELVEQLQTFSFIRKRQKEAIKIKHNSMPNGKILIVDDVETNLYVAEGLMQPYHLQIDKATSGEKVLEKIKKGNVYDIIFMDHMMPNMDGIETTLILRSMGYTGVIVALTANAIAGNAEMFKEKGFDDFISKPIDVGLLDTVLHTYIPDDNQNPVNKSQPDISTTKINPKLLEIFIKDAKKAVITLKETLKSEDIKLFTVSAHAMKSALLNIKENEMSQKAADLEKAGLKGDLAFITENTESFVQNLENLINKLLPSIPSNVEPELASVLTGKEERGIINNSELDQDSAYLIEKLQIIQSACDDYNDALIFSTLEDLRKNQYSQDIVSRLEDIKDTIYFQSDFEKASDLTNNLLKVIRQ